MNIIINGGTRGIGKEIVLIMAEDKSNKVFVTGRNIDALKQLSCEAVHGNIYTHATDMSQFDEHEKSFMDAVTAVFNDIDILINNAGYLVHRDFMNFDKEDARKLMETNFFGPASVIHLLQPLMKKGSHIINISSMGGFQGSSKYRGMSYYSASKAALSCLSECLAAEFREAGIAVNCLALGSVQTEMFEEAFPGLKAPVDARQMALYIADFAINGNKYFNGKILPVAFSDP
jgi:NAD(P)-dependent dehydrogenase (short-subunit alcohol dehydrogenase family)